MVVGPFIVLPFFGGFPLLALAGLLSLIAQNSVLLSG